MFNNSRLWQNTKQCHHHHVVKYSFSVHLYKIKGLIDFFSHYLDLYIFVYRLYWLLKYFNSQDRLIESFLNLKSLNYFFPSGHGAIWLVLVWSRFSYFCPRSWQLMALFTNSVSVVNEGKLCFSTIFNNMGSLWALTKRERIFLYQVFPQDVLRPQVQFFPTFIMTSWLANTVKPYPTDTSLLRTVYFVPGERKPLHFL